VINLLLTLLLLGLMALVVCGFWTLTSHERRKAELRVRQQAAERAVDREASRAKHAMNDAAGQPWRNLVD
jgi:type II secretory pathway pseudopilin PulG